MTLTYHNVRVKVGSEVYREVVPVEAHDGVTTARRNDLAAAYGISGVANRFGVERWEVRLLTATRIRGIKPVQL